MILATTYATGQIPFKTVYLHGLVRAENGRKMSKSEPETMLDPLEVIPEYGTDALRLALVSGENAGHDQRLGRSKIVDNRNFCNKLWNVARYIEASGGAGQSTPKTPAGHWILDKSSILTGAVDEDIDNFRFGEAYQKLYHFIWDDLADWYIEASKSEPNPALLRSVLETTLISLHPFAPFITETIWQQLGHNDLLAAQQLPDVPNADKAQAAKFEELMEAVSFVRQLKAAANVKEIRVFTKHTSSLDSNLISLLEKLTRVKAAGDKDRSLSPGVKFSTSNYDYWFDVDEDELSKAIAKLETKAKKSQESMERMQERLANRSYVDNAPPELVEETKNQLEQEQRTLEEIESEIKALEG
jgi:valyl-tRNA synthetase